MIPDWPRKSPHAKAAKRLREAIDTTTYTDALTDFMLGVCMSRREALEHLREMRDVVTKAIADIDALLSDQGDGISNDHATNIRDTIDTLTSERKRP